MKRTLALLLITSLVTSSEAWAGASPSPSPSTPASQSASVAPSPAPTVTQTVTVPAAQPSGDPCSNKSSQGNNQSDQYCKAADTADEGKDTNDILTKVWAGVAGVCAAACAVSFGGANPYGKAADMACVGANLGGAGTDAAMTKNYEGAVASIVANQQGIMNTLDSLGSSGSSTANGANGANAKGGSNSHASCLTAATSALQAVTKGMAANDAEKSSQVNRQLASDMTAPDVPMVANSGTPLVPLDSTAVGNNANAGAPVGSAALASGSADTPKNNTVGSADSGSGCRAAKASGSTERMIQCALAADPNLPKFVATPQFAENLKGVSGLDLGSLLKGKRVSGQAAVTGLSGGVLGSERTQALGKVLEQYEAFETGAAAYASGGRGGGGAAGGAGDEFDLNGAMKSLMSQLGGDGEGGGGPNAAAKGPNFRGPAASIASKDGDENNRRISIFERIARRYFVIAPRLAP